MTYILSIHSGHESSAALFADYQILAAVQKERLTRVKKDGGAPHDCVAEVLAIAGLSLADVDVVVLAGASAHDAPAGKAVFIADHQAARALPALFFTDWDDALIFTADGAGYGHRVFRDGQLRTFSADGQAHGTHSMARAYGAVTKALGFRPLHHEGKVTGLAARGKPVLKGLFDSHFRMDGDGMFTSDFRDTDQMARFFMEACKGVSREDASASIQSFVEDQILASVRLLVEREKVRHLGLSGGLFANVRLNQRLAEECGLSEIFVLPPMGDEGLVIGGALQYLLERDGLETWLHQRRRLDNVYWGRPFPHAGKRIGDFSTTIARLPGNPVENAARLVAEGKAVAVFGERMEYGPRALGARSIMASPSRRDINDSINKRLDREDFMPFAPVVTDVDACKVFDITDVNAYACRFMTITCNVKPEWRDRIPAVVHVDNTARPQIICRKDNPLYYDILVDFQRQTGLAAAVNTSFNVHEQPIINTPEEAATALVDNRVDYLATADGVYGVSGRP